MKSSLSSSRQVGAASDGVIVGRLREPSAVVGPTPARTAARMRVRVADAWVLAALLVIAGALFAAAVPSWIAPVDPTDMNSDAILAAPGAGHLFGTDQFGRDVFTLVVYGARQSLLIGVFSVLVGAGLGVALGLVAGYAGGLLDMVLMRLIDIWMAIPNILLAIALSTALGPSLATTIFAVSMQAIPRYARVLRGQALAVRSRPFVMAARASGASHWAIVRGHILPHCGGTIMVMATLGVGSAIVMGAGLSFLGLGVNDERPDWGYLLTQCRGYLTVAWWTVTFPGLAITALVIAVNVVGDALQRRFQPRSAAR
jgi:peptide/nickel transport system permease protein